MLLDRRTIATARGEMTWLEAGAGWPLLLLHAFPLNAAMWGPQLERVPAGWRFIAPDLRGFGPAAAPPAQPLTMDDYAADVAALMDALEIDSAAIGGLSMGGYVTFALYRMAPLRFTGMMLADTRAVADSPQARDGRAALRQVLTARGSAGVAAEMLPRLLSPTARPGVAERVRAMIEGESPEAIDAAIAAMLSRPDSTPDLPRIACAALVVLGSADAIVPVSEAEEMQRAMPRATLTVLEGAGHLASLEQPDAFSRALSDFLLGYL